METESYTPKGRVGQYRFGYFTVKGQRNRWAVLPVSGVGTTHFMHPGDNNMSAAVNYAARLNGGI